MIEDNILPEPNSDEEELHDLLLHLEQFKNEGMEMSGEMIQDVLYHLYTLSSRNFQLQREISALES